VPHEDERTKTRETSVSEKCAIKLKGREKVRSIIESENIVVGRARECRMKNM